MSRGKGEVVLVGRTVNVMPNGGERMRSVETVEFPLLREVISISELRRFWAEGEYGEADEWRFL